MGNDVTRNGRRIIPGHICWEPQPVGLEWQPVWEDTNEEIGDDIGLTDDELYNLGDQAWDRFRCRGEWAVES